MMTGRNVPWLLSQWGARTPDKTFLIWEPVEGEPVHWTYAAFGNAVMSVAASLQRRGVSAGERVLLQMDNCPELLIAWFACAQLGAVAVSINTRCVEREIEYFASHVGAVAAIAQSQYAPTIARVAPNLRFLIVSSEPGEPADQLALAGATPFSQLLSEAGSCGASHIQSQANLCIQFTSGTTSRSKAVVWTHANALWAAQLNAWTLGLRPDDVGLIVLPLFHANALSLTLGALWVGGTLVIHPRFSASRFWPAAVRHQCTWTSLVQFCIRALGAYPVPTQHPFRLWWTGAHSAALEKHFRVRTSAGWGMTEITTNAIVGDYSHPGPEWCIGRASPGYEIEIRRADGSPIAAGERGDLFVRGQRGVTLFKEYFGDPEATAQAFDAQGWFRTGDVVRMDEHGSLFFSDRAKDMVRVGGENVSAQEIESVLMATGLIADCAVVAKPDAMLEEVPVAFVVAAASAPADLQERLFAACKQALADFKVVREIHFVEQLPRSTMEKVAKRELRARLLAEGSISPLPQSPAAIAAAQ